jgi:hypothetical protein
MGACDFFGKPLLKVFQKNHMSPFYSNRKFSIATKKGNQKFSIATKKGDRKVLVTTKTSNQKISKKLAFSKRKM